MRCGDAPGLPALLAQEPKPSTYAALAAVLRSQGNITGAEAVAREALAIHEGSLQLTRVAAFSPLALSMRTLR